MKETIVVFIMMIIITPIIFCDEQEDFRKNERNELRQLIDNEEDIDKFLFDMNKPREKKSEKIDRSQTREHEYDMVIITNALLLNIF